MISDSALLNIDPPIYCYFLLVFFMLWFRQYFMMLLYEFRIAFEKIAKNYINDKMVEPEIIIDTEHIKYNA